MMIEDNKIYYAIEFMFKDEDKYFALLEFQGQLWADFPRMNENPSYYLFQDAIWHSER